MTSNLTFAELSKANEERCRIFHEGGIEEWSREKWFNAVVGEVGEFATWAKKLDRGEITEIKFQYEAAKELADIVTYIDLLAQKLGVDLGEAVRWKFNEVSDRINSTIKL